MTGVEKIKEEILAEARHEAEANVSRAKAKADDLLRKAREEAERKKQTILEKATQEGEDKRQRILATTELEGRKKRLQAKQEVLEEVFAKVMAALNSMPVKEYSKVLTEMIINSVKTGTEEIVLTEKDRGRLSETFLANVNLRLSKEGKTGGLKFSDVVGDFQGGFILKSGDVEVNQSFDAILRMQHDELEALAIKVLFG